MGRMGMHGGADFEGEAEAGARAARPDRSSYANYGAHVPTHAGGMLFVHASGMHAFPAAQPVVTGGSPEMVQRPPLEASQFPVFGLQTVPVRHETSAQRLERFSTISVAACASDVWGSSLLGPPQAPSMAASIMPSPTIKPSCVQ